MSLQIEKPIISRNLLTTIATSGSGTDASES
ncbi:unannotated protein [freshwater metagenome]|uniref:Unannotated protein n=1 Tax=freshwater metagenome TaxID=449393 RepID=A0A6J6VQ91_9ZZZZ